MPFEKSLWQRLNFTTLLPVMFKLGAEMHFFATLVTFISIFIFRAVCPYVRICVMFVFVLIVTMVIMIPSSFGVGIDMSV